MEHQVLQFMLQGATFFRFDTVFLGGCQLVTLYNLLTFPFVTYYFSFVL